MFDDLDEANPFIRRLARRMLEEWLSQCRGVHCARSRAKRGHGSRYVCGDADQTEIILR